EAVEDGAVPNRLSPALSSLSTSSPARPPTCDHGGERGPRHGGGRGAGVPSERARECRHQRARRRLVSRESGGVPMQEGRACEVRVPETVLGEVLWRRLDEVSLERCRITQVLDFYAITGTVLTVAEGEPFELQYMVQCDPD